MVESSRQLERFKTDVSAQGYKQMMGLDSYRLRKIGHLCHIVNRFSGYIV